MRARVCVHVWLNSNHELQQIMCCAINLHSIHPYTHLHTQKHTHTHTHTHTCKHTHTHIRTHTAAAGVFGPMNVANVLWALGTLKRAPSRIQIHIHTFTHTRTQTHTHTHAHTHVNTQTHAHSNTYTHSCCWSVRPHGRGQCVVGPGDAKTRTPFGCNAAAAV